MVEKICGKGEFWAWNGTVNVWWRVKVVSKYVFSLRRNRGRDGADVRWSVPKPGTSSSKWPISVATEKQQLHGSQRPETSVV